MLQLGQGFNLGSSPKEKEKVSGEGGGVTLPRWTSIS